MPYVLFILYPSQAHCDPTVAQIPPNGKKKVISGIFLKGCITLSRESDLLKGGYLTGTRNTWARDSGSQELRLQHRMNHATVFNYTQRVHMHHWTGCLVSQIVRLARYCSKLISFSAFSSSKFVFCRAASLRVQLSSSSVRVSHLLSSGQGWVVMAGVVIVGVVDVVVDVGAVVVTGVGDASAIWGAVASGGSMTLIVFVSSCGVFSCCCCCAFDGVKLRNCWSCRVHDAFFGEFF